VVNGERDGREDSRGRRLTVTSDSSDRPAPVVQQTERTERISFVTLEIVTVAAVDSACVSESVLVAGNGLREEQSRGVVMSVLDWLRGGHLRGREGGINLVNKGHSQASVRILGTRVNTPEVPAFQERLVRVPAGKYSVRFELEDEIEVYQVDGVMVESGMVTPFMLSGRVRQGQRVRMVSGPV
jgi:hypothetical protein